MSRESTTRKYEQKARADQQDEMRTRITVAAMDLHGSVGPANTTIKGVADRAGVQRATVYRYFKNDDELFAACSSHWMALNPPPDVSVWMAESDPDSRTTAGLTELYEYYGQTAEMFSNLIRDESLHPSIPPLIANFWGFLEIAAELLVKGRGLRGRKVQRTRAAARLAVDFTTWQRLVDREGLRADEAAEIMTKAIAEAA
ncbi:MAG: TetR/AcrR family transcriptional regulator [Solirubrobacterales bacterium]